MVERLKVDDCAGWLKQPEAGTEEGEESGKIEKGGSVEVWWWEKAKEARILEEVRNKSVAESGWFISWIKDYSVIW